jgi:hypothetical protein
MFDAVVNNAGIFSAKPFTDMAGSVAGHSYKLTHFAESC